MKIEGNNYLKLVKENHELQKSNDTLEQQVGVLKTFIQQNDGFYKYGELRMIFARLGNMFSQN